MRDKFAALYAAFCDAVCVIKKQFHLDARMAFAVHRHLSHEQHIVVVAADVAALVDAHTHDFAALCAAYIDRNSVGITIGTATEDHLQPLLEHILFSMLVTVCLSFLLLFVPTKAALFSIAKHAIPSPEGGRNSVFRGNY